MILVLDNARDLARQAVDEAREETRAQSRDIMQLLEASRHGRRD